MQKIFLLKGPPSPFIQCNISPPSKLCWRYFKINRMIKLVICDDHQMFADGLEKLIHGINNCKIIGRATQGADLIQMIKKNIKPDIVLLDIHMPPGLNGYSVVKYCKEHFPGIKFIALSVFNDNEAVSGMIKSGADGFLWKGMSKEILERAITEVAAGKPFFDLQKTSSARKRLNQNGGVQSLTERELEAAKLMCTDKPYKQIAKELEISPNTIENIRVRIFKKLGAKTRTDVALFMTKTGMY
jgi:DNA-binding NarL/FixJ family response regulator